MTQSITQRLSRIQKALKAPKASKNTFGNYNFRNAEQILESVKHILEDGEIVTINDEIVFYGNLQYQTSFEGDVVLEDGQVINQKKTTIYGDRFYIKATASLGFGSEKISASAFAREPMEKKGMDASQITGATSSYAKKYALSNLFAIDDSKDDPDSKDNTHEGKEENGTIKGRLADNPDIKEDMQNLGFDAEKIYNEVMEELNLCDDLESVQKWVDKNKKTKRVQGLPKNLKDDVMASYNSVKNFLENKNGV